MKFENLNDSVVRDISKDEPEWFVQERLESLESFNRTNDDSFKYGMTMKTDISGIKISDYKSKVNIIVRNKDDRITVDDFKESLEKNPGLIREYFMKKTKTKTELLHRALIQNGLVVYAPKNSKGGDNLMLDYEFYGNSFNHLLVIADENSEVNIIERLRGSGVFHSNIVEVYAKENSKVNFYSLQDLDGNSGNFSVKRGFVSRNAECNFFNFEFGCLLNCSDVYSELDEEGSYSKVYGIYFTDKNQHFNLAYSMHHKAKNTNSNIFTKGVLEDMSNTIYRGLIKIHDNAENSNGYQKEDTLILGDDAKADSIPNLEIGNNDVKCSHGASIGHIDSDKLFYLKSRGISEKECTKLIVNGFLGEVIDKINNEDFKLELKNKVMEKVK
ncbi:MAG: SufBD protein [Berkelbacteria bacterium GW2011_GWA1_36_9]|uniref:SufBD protein n=1 Tax=Berkelbacteria bacterium GW2011_GWA1_36_9 TaxID=1618331 RepID=A0A0G0FEX3_9BACT|nr:MAG: SufBD protein [Berkelbacteria bacterium GW2011_GWA1_36_9]